MCALADYIKLWLLMLAYDYSNHLMYSLWQFKRIVWAPLLYPQKYFQVSTVTPNFSCLYMYFKRSGCCCLSFNLRPYCPIQSVINQNSVLYHGNNETQIWSFLKTKSVILLSVLGAGYIMQTATCFYKHIYFHWFTYIFKTTTSTKQSKQIVYKNYRKQLLNKCHHKGK